MANKDLYRNKIVKPTNNNYAKNMAHDFNNFFHEKIMTIHNGFLSTSQSADISSVEESCTSIMDTFDLHSTSEIKQLLKMSSNASCGSSPMPTWFVKEYQDIFIGQIAKIFSTSLSDGVFPLSMKTALIKPLINRYNLVCNVLNNFRPLLNLPKIIESSVAVRINKYLLDSNLIQSRQSAYRTVHSTETALIRVQNDIVMSIDQSKVIILVLLGRFCCI